MNDLERRWFAVEDMRAEDGEGGPVLRGYAAVFNSNSEDMGFIERIAPGAFTKTLQESRDILALWNHNPDLPLASRAAGSLSLTEDDRGLAFEAHPVDTSWGRDAVAAVRAKVVRGMSFSFRTVKDAWDQGGKVPVRTLHEVKLYEVSPTPFPAYPRTNVQARAILVEAGLDWDGVTAVLARAMRGLTVTDLDRQVIRSAVDVLNSYLRSEPGEAHSEPEPGSAHSGRSVRLLRRRLELELVG